MLGLDIQALHDYKRKRKKNKGEINEGKETYSGDSYGGDPRDVPRGCTGNDVRGTRDGRGSSCGGRKGTYTGRVREKAEEDAYNMEIQSNGWKNWPQGPAHTGKRRS